jgi:tetratricopeptide (TPR) repeat protein
VNLRYGVWTVIELGLILLSTGLLSIAPGVHAQQGSVDSPQLCTATGMDSFQAACTDYAACILSTGFNPDCSLQLFHEILAACQESPCKRDILLKLAIIVVAGDHHAERSDSESFEANLIDSLQNIQVQDYQTAAEILLALYDEYQHRYLQYVAGLIYESAGQSDNALKAYANAELTQFYTPLVYYSRGYLYLNLGDMARASRDFYTFSILRNGEPQLAMLSIPPDSTDDVLADSEIWTVFPLASYGSSPGGDSDSYLFDTPAYDVEIVWLDQAETLAVRNLFRVESMWNWPLPQLLFFHCEDNYCFRSLNFQQTFPGLSIGGTFAEIDFDDDYARITWRSVAGEGVTLNYQVMMLAPAEDPRPSVLCEHGVYPRVHEGDTVDTEPFRYTYLYTEPSMESDVVALTSPDMFPFVITSDLVCGEEGNWWPVSLPDGTTGWILEAIDDVYQLRASGSSGRLTIDELLSLP